MMDSQQDIFQLMRQAAQNTTDLALQRELLFGLPNGVCSTNTSIRQPTIVRSRLT